jgi:acetyl-CoA carboxylase beta subunit
MIDMVVPRGQLREKLSLLVSYLSPEEKEAA